jgi:hypothetical protein
MQEDEVPPSISLLTVQFLTWLADRPRTYADVMEAWRSTCPRISVWEDSFTAGLVRCEGGGRRAVSLTPRGRTVLEQSAAAAPTKGGTEKKESGAIDEASGIDPRSQ